MSLIDNNKAKILKGGKEGGTGADDNEWLSGGENLFPDTVARSLSLLGVNEDYFFIKSVAENLNELGSEGDFWN